ncbi:ATP synthase F1 subunit delta [Senegalimassilia anaerobia]|uniref:ATP synthase subunit delta n=1 Tax=Gordonibacter massiliensis (ex Traore et al. 2017) TaxID=1841863 RepID=A0A842JGB7_9ACTN|nr:ATP synthase F1 subunit delta [Gordonibacter massiliensis (ex Traore et al. 2017)]MBC2888958.1 ATP synthase F1 subunit delta [Gordonibacter massiliensis (ex Traore et al. 2017)]
MPTNRLIVKEEVAVYAAVLFDGAFEAGGRDAVLEVRDQMVRVAESMRTNMELSVALSDPGYTPEQRAELARNVFAGCNPVLLDVLAVLAERGDAALLPRVLESFAEQLQSKLNVCVVDVTTAVELDDDLRRIITEKAEADLDTNVVLRESVDKSILGGIIMSTNGKRIDASVVSQLDHARNVLKTTTDGGEC